MGARVTARRPGRHPVVRRTRHPPEVAEDVVDAPRENQGVAWHWTSGADIDNSDLERLAHGSLDFIDALGLAEADLLGFSLGVRPPEDVLLLSPRLVATSQRAR